MVGFRVGEYDLFIGNIDPFICFIIVMAGLLVTFPG